ncbi:MAG: ZIP family metal transporter [Leptolyngbya sp.]|nr:ZIP family metal transporter [Candidatus Melainabacteria bacterium]
MYEFAIYAFLSAIAVSAISLIGIASFSMSPNRLHKTTNLLVSLAAGAMLGNALLHLLPHSLEHASERPAIVQQHAHSAHERAPDHEKHEEHHDHDATRHGEENHDPDHDAPHGQVKSDSHDEHGHPGLGIAALILAGLLSMMAFDFALLSRTHGKSNSVKPAAYLVLLTDGLENFLDGLVIGTAYLVSIPLGVATTIAVLVHEIPIEMGDFAVLIKSGFSKKKALLLNFLSGLLSIAGVAVALYAASFVPTFASIVTPMAAGAFIYLAGSALIPQIREDRDGPSKLTSFAMILVGVAIMALLLLIE